MKSTSSFKRGVAKARREWLAKRYDRALAQVDRLLEEWADNPQLLVMWADLVQLQGGEDGPTLEDAKAAYQRAADLDQPSPSALLELGHFHYAVEDDAEKATQFFAKAINLCKSQLRQALLGQAKALAERDRKAEALACLAEAYWLETHDSKQRNGADGQALLNGIKELALAD
jgi:hypothetical protein